MLSLSDDENSDSKPELNVNNEYAKNYNQWRQKEEVHKLKQKYGEDACDLNNFDGESSDSSEDDDEVEVPEKIEEDFLKVLALLKSKDPKIYDHKVSFFNETNEKDEENERNKKKKAKKEKAVTLRDFERKIILERGGKYSDSEDEEDERKMEKRQDLTYVQEQDEIRKSFKAALEDDDEDESIFVVKDKSAEQIRKEETRKKWLKGQEVEVDCKDAALKPIRDFWADPSLDPGEKFLRDYILDKKYLEKNASDADLEYDQMAHDSDANLSEDEQNIDRQEEFEYKYNFRFEEPDQEFIKRYPRTLENSLRKKDTRRSEKRAELKERKEHEKVRKKEELKELKALKRKEIEEKIEKLKEITGNDDIGINMEDLEGDFDPNEYDQKMQKMFNDEYYTAPENDLKPEFPEIDKEINAPLPFNDELEEDYCDEEPDCEDPNFIMDADYDPSADVESKDKGSSKKKKKGRNKNIQLPKDKPKFDPEVYSTFQEYIDRCYALDYEDMIGDIPCRFKLRKSVPNDYGLTIEEILMTDDKELNKWCSLKKALEFKPEEVEKNEVRRFQQKAKNDALKRKILKSFYSPEGDEESQEGTPSTEQPKKRKNKKKKKKGNELENESIPADSVTTSTSENEQSVPGIENNMENESLKNKTLKSKKRKHSDISNEENEKEAVQKKKKKNKKGNTSNEVVSTVDDEVKEVPRNEQKKVNLNNGMNASMTRTVNGLKIEKIVQTESGEEHEKKKKTKKGDQNVNVLVGNLKTETLTEMTKKVGCINENSKSSKKKKSNQQNNISNGEVEIKVTEDEASKEERKSEKLQKLMRQKENRRKKLLKKQKYSKLQKESARKESQGKNSDELASMSSDRLKAFGAHPKKFKNRLKYGKKPEAS